MKKVMFNRLRVLSHGKLYFETRRVPHTVGIRSHLDTWVSTTASKLAKRKVRKKKRNPRKTGKFGKMWMKHQQYIGQ